MSHKTISCLYALHPIKFSQCTPPASPLADTSLVQTLDQTDIWADSRSAASSRHAFRRMTNLVENGCAVGPCMSCHELMSSRRSCIISKQITKCTCRPTRWYKQAIGMSKIKSLQVSEGEHESVCRSSDNVDCQREGELDAVHQDRQRMTYTVEDSYSSYCSCLPSADLSSSHDASCRTCAP